MYKIKICSRLASQEAALKTFSSLGTGIVFACTVFIFMSVPGLLVSRELSELETCILDVIGDAPDEMTIGEARNQCEEPVEEGVIGERLTIDETNVLKPFTLMAHNASYILLGAHNFNGWSPDEYAAVYDLDSLEVDDTEVQFQLSIKFPLATDLFDHNLDLFAGYTVKSFWQLYNSDASSPFRETNHEPEVWLQHRPENWEFMGVRHVAHGIGFTHVSNGQGGPLSRSWNRVYMAFAFEYGENLAFMIKPWIRIEEDPEDDDNPDITDYYGHGEFGLAYKLDNHTFSFRSRNNLESGFSTGSIELGWSFPIFHYPYVKGYLQYFSGYGESLIDYDQYVNRLGIGLILSDIL